jgi:U3 small nucleolar RNA-associated protein 12
LQVLFWEYDVVDTDVSGRKQVSLVLVRSLAMSDEALCVRHSRDGKLIAIGLLDCTVKVFYHDSLKFFL